MEKRVYPLKRCMASKISICLLLLTAAVVISGLWGEKLDSGLEIVPAPTTTPIPLDETFDETMTEAEIELPSSEWYALQLGAFENEASAAEMAQQFAKRGAAGYVWQDGRFRALAAVYPFREDAQQVRQQLETQHGIDTYLYQIELPPVRLKLSGMRGQLDILQAAFLHVNDLIRSLQEISIFIDRRELNADETITGLQELNSQLETVALRLRQRFQTPRHQAVEGLLQILDGFHAFCADLQGQNSSVGLAAKVKYQTFSALHGLRQVYDTLIHRR